MRDCPAIRIFTKIMPLGFSFDIAKRIAFNKQRSFSRFIIRLSIAATTLSVAAMILTLAFVNGFQQTVASKIFSFWGHIRVQHYEAGKSLIAEETPFTYDSSISHIIQTNNNVLRVQAFATKSAVIESKGEIEGVLLKGIDRGYDSSELKSFFTAGNWLQFEDSNYSKQIIVSKALADQLNIRLNDTLKVHFVSSIDDSRTYRKLQVTGIYKTGIEEYDKLFVIGDIQLIRRINEWRNDQIGGYEVFVKDYTKMDSVSRQLSEQLPVEWMSRTIREVYPNIFDWLNIQDVNRDVIFIVMSAVAIINLITCLLILILERTRMVGILKALGADNWTIQKIFLYHASVITITGIVLGLILGVGICWLQQLTGFIRLDETSYYVREAPMIIIWWQVLAITVGTAVVCYASLIIPSLLIRKVNPVKAIQFR
ncbi:MAG: FtsX-like permease family protein [Sediminibacterium sp.]|uniref:ABC transporter permease n=1 Tax=Sediminibacterium sp. TaxID=1917865 RepID=UPI002ABB2349|nr:FtsX-like permease family protein [Sediminibacterium sp.]MDZ4072304.1 FtsX-like permease family protein [Sediminibacterium sp.]